MTNGERKVTKSKQLLPEEVRYNRFIGQQIAKRKWTQTEFARRAGWEKGRVTRLLKGETKWTLRDMAQAARALGMKSKDHTDIVGV